MRNNYLLRGVCALVAVCASVVASDAANCPGTITDDYETNEDIVVTAVGANCIHVNGSNITVNLHGNSIICNHASGCGVGVLVSNSASNVVVQDGRIVEGTGKWGTGVQNGTSGGAAVTTTVRNVSVIDSQIGVIFPYRVENSVFTEMSIACAASFGYAASDGFIKQNFCSSAAYGFFIKGGATSPTSTLIERNYVRAVYDAIDTASGGYTTVTRNVIAAGSPTIDPGANSTVSINLCDDCTDPDYNFSLDVDFDE